MEAAEARVRKRVPLLKRQRRGAAWLLNRMVSEHTITGPYLTLVRQQL